MERIATTDQLLQPVYPKDLEAPICACFGLTRVDVEQDVEERTNRRVKELWQKSQSPEARCATLAANGTCCMPEVQKYFLRLREQAGLA